MKNVLKAFGVIAIVAVIGFSMTACKEEEEAGDAYLTVVNQFDKAVTKVIVSASRAGAVPQTFDNLNITKGNSQTFTIPDTVFDTSVDLHARSNAISVTCSGDDRYESRVRFVAFQSGKTVTITVNAGGRLE
jgi:hypothetical protein